MDSSRRQAIRQPSSRSVIPESPVQGDLSRAIVARRTEYASGHHVRPHWHARAQFAYAVDGTIRVRSARRVWIVPPSRALWIPAGTAHEVQMYGTVKMHSLYITGEAARGMPDLPVVFNVTPLLRELIVRAVELTPDCEEAADEGLIMRLLSVELRRLTPCALDLPLPESAELMRLCERLLGDLSMRRPCGVDASELDVSPRTLYRRFLRETGITFARWKQQARLLEAIRRLAQGVPVTTVAVDLGYDSPSAFSTMFRRALGTAPRHFRAGEARGTPLAPLS
jgi:quercetin dioxygenase-like cupin family protein